MPRRRGEQGQAANVTKGTGKKVEKKTGNSFVQWSILGESAENNTKENKQLRQLRE